MFSVFKRVFSLSFELPRFIGSIFIIHDLCCLELTLSTGTLAFGPNLWVQPLRFKVLWTFSMLRLVGGPSVNTLLITPFECSYPVSMASP